MLVKKIIEIQSTLKAPKGQMNKFGNYRYRSSEDILEAVKPLLKEQGLILNLSDEICLIGERYYVKATATITDGTDKLEVTAYAREADDKKGMDSSQVTGATSSYARKYALNGLLCIDDTKDADATNTHGKEATEVTKADMDDDTHLIGSTQIKHLQKLIEFKGVDGSKVLSSYKVSDFAEMNFAMYKNAVAKLEKTKRVANES